MMAQWRAWLRLLFWDEDFVVESPGLHTLALLALIGLVFFLTIVTAGIGLLLGL